MKREMSLEFDVGMLKASIDGRTLTMYVQQIMLEGPLLDQSTLQQFEADGGDVKALEREADEMMDRLWTLGLAKQLQRARR